MSSKLVILICIILTLILHLLIIRKDAHACEIEPGDWEAIEEEIAQNGK